MKRRHQEITSDRVTLGIYSKICTMAAIKDRRTPVLNEPSPFRMAYITESGERIEREFYGSPDDILDQLKCRNAKLIFMEV